MKVLIQTVASYRCKITKSIETYMYITSWWKYVGQLNNTMTSELYIIMRQDKNTEMMIY